MPSVDSMRIVSSTSQAELLRAVADRGYTPSLTFHPGTQCVDPHAWEAYIAAAKDICDMAGVRDAMKNGYGDEMYAETFEGMADEQLLEHAGAVRAGVPIATPVFDGAKEGDVDDALKRAAGAVELMVQGEVDQAMNQFN